MDQLMLISLEIGVLWTAFFGLTLMVSRKWAKGYARWSFKTVRRMVAWPFLTLGKFIKGK